MNFTNTSVLHTDSYYNYHDNFIYLNSDYPNMMFFIPFVINMCASLPALIFMLYFLYTLRKHGSQILSFVLLLIINDFVELLLSAILTSFVCDKLVKSSATTLKQYIEEWEMMFMLIQSRLSTLIQLLITFRLGGIYLHQLVALQRILSLKIQRCSVNVFSPLCITISCVILWLLTFLSQLFDDVLFICLSFLTCGILAITIILTHKSSRSPDHNNPDSAVLLISILTLISFCATAGPVFILILLSREDYIKRHQLIPAFSISLRVLADPLLCVLVYNKQFKTDKPQINTELSSGQRSI